MATTRFGVVDTLTVKLWGKKLMAEALRATPIAPLIGTSADSVIQLKNEIKSSGDKVTFGLRTQLTGDGVTEGEIQEGNEESLTTYADSVLINELMHAVKVAGKDSIDQQRVLFNLRDEAKAGLKDWWAARLSVSFFNQVAGMTATSGTGAPSSTKYTGLNAALAPTSGRHIWSESGATADQDLDSTGDTFTITLLDKAKELAKTSTATGSPIRPLMIGGEEKYVCYLHPYQVYDLRTDAATAGNWFDIQKAAMQGGKVSNNPIYTGALGEYNGIILRESFHVPNGVNASTLATITTVKRAVFLGAQAAAMAFGGNDDAEGMNWVEETFDFRRALGIMAGKKFGLKKTQFNGVDFGTIVISTYAAAHA
jgi:N4-gp56 family major capsid protein